MNLNKQFMQSGESKRKNLTADKVDPKELKMGIKVEMEHTTKSRKSLPIAKKISLDHLAESPKYYSYLAEMEKKMPKHASWKGRKEQLRYILKQTKKRLADISKKTTDYVHRNPRKSFAAAGFVGGAMTGLYNAAQRATDPDVKTKELRKEIYDKAIRGTIGGAIVGDRYDRIQRNKYKYANYNQGDNMTTSSIVKVASDLAPAEKPSEIVKVAASDTLNVVKHSLNPANLFRTGGVARGFVKDITGKDPGVAEGLTEGSAANLKGLKSGLVSGGLSGAAGYGAAKGLSRLSKFKHLKGKAGAIGLALGAAGYLKSAPKAYGKHLREYAESQK